MRAPSKRANSVLVIDVGGTHVKVLATRQREEREIPSGSNMTARKMVRDVKRVTKDWEYGLVSIGYPGPVIHGRPLHEPYNLGGGINLIRQGIRLMNWGILIVLNNYLHDVATAVLLSSAVVFYVLARQARDGGAGRSGRSPAPTGR